MHNVRARNARRGLTVTVQHAIEQGAAPVARGRMYDIASGFVNDDERLVFIKNIQRHGFGSESAHIRRSFGMDHNHCGFKRRLVQTLARQRARNVRNPRRGRVRESASTIIIRVRVSHHQDTQVLVLGHTLRKMALAVAAIMISGCSFLSDKLKEASTWSDEKLYEHAQQALSEHDWG